MLGFLHSRAALALAATSLAAGGVAPANAQFGGLLGSISRGASSPQTESTSSGCPEGKKKSAGSAILGSLAGSVANRAAGRLSSFVPIPEVADMLTNAIACKLDTQEQKQAAEATLAATRGKATVGSSSEWTSTTRENVSGRSTVTASNQVDASGLQCITVTDVVIVSGEETTANKRMCKPKGGARYSLMA